MLPHLYLLPQKGSGSATVLVAATGLHHHVPLFPEDNVVVAVIKENEDGTELRGGTASLGNSFGLHQVDLQGKEQSHWGRQASFRRAELLAWSRRSNPPEDTPLSIAPWPLSARKRKCFKETLVPRRKCSSFHEWAICQPWQKYLFQKL